MDTTLGERVALVNEGIADAARAAGRNIYDITTIVVTKFHPAQLVRDLYDLGVRNVGENRHQEAEAKAAELAHLDLTWHFIGQLQSNKARAVRKYAQVLHSVDRPSLVNALANAAMTPEGLPENNAVEILDCFVQLNLTQDPGRGGVQPADVVELAELVAAQPSLNLLGVMAVAPLDEEPRVAFARVKAASERVQTVIPQANFISAGMSHDYAAAIAEGATHLRIGSAITGNRPVAG
ncbi:YggS family pyridoxal phosphate-dependent enzyme [Aurantimicrobium minutum]|uniref:Pyridoxal phosphate homeostasis protein n=1 Tax=Aurantimicrobium minutum TaxID=708131 RepID=A0A173LVR4_9MICO|nr:YggS family pyridoxal phosphate-dependent enzyme [Aurantimicrobium minutum]BAU98939.1 pyridoxal 5'-phosphate-dependent enzyme [Aurantimicrobium minutum]